MFLVVLFVLAFGAVNGQMEEAPCEASTMGFDCMMELADYFTLHWTVDGTDVAMAAEGVTEGWVGFAFAEMEDAMAPADFVIGYVNEDEATVTPFRSESRVITDNELDDSVTLTDVSGVEEDGVTTIFFTRSTEDGTVEIDLTGPVLVNFAIGEADQLAYHGPTNRGSTSISFT